MIMPFCHARGARPHLFTFTTSMAERREGQQNDRVQFPLSRSRLILAAAQILGDAVTTNNGPQTGRRRAVWLVR